jgi:putative transposase
MGEVHMERTHGRPQLRLPDYDYSSDGAYFLTICTVDRRCLFGDVVEGEMVLNDFGRIVEEEWVRSEEIRSEIQLGAFIVMPNHLHGIIIISRDVDANGRLHLPASKSPRRPRSISSFAAGFKTASTKRINALRGTRGQKMWQANFYEHIIRTERSYHRITTYIHANPRRWAWDVENPLRQKKRNRLVDANGRLHLANKSLSSK